jgi:hypothetical protein
MEPGNWIALGAVAAGLIGTGSANWLSWSLGNKRFKHERDIADRDAIGMILEEAAVEVHEFAYCLDDLRSGLISLPVTFFTAGDGNAVFEKMEAAGRVLDARAERLKVRLAGDATATAFEKLNDVALEMFRITGLIRLETDDYPLDAVSRKAAKDNVVEMRDELAELRRHFDRHRDAFRQASYAAVGVPATSSTSERLWTGSMTAAQHSGDPTP